MQAPPYSTSNSLLGGACSGCCALFLENQAAPRRLSTCCLCRGSTSALRRALGDTPCSLEKGGLREPPELACKYSEQEARQHSLHTSQGAFVQTLGNILTWISDQCCLQTPWPQVTSLLLTSPTRKAGRLLKVHLRPGGLTGSAASPKYQCESRHPGPQRLGTETSRAPAG